MFAKDLGTARAGPPEGHAGKIVDKYHSNRESWINFCLFPDIVEPCKMPSLFPAPTHICRRQLVTTIQAPGSGTIYGMWKPTTIALNDIASGYRTAFFYRTSAPSGANDDVGAEAQNDAAVTQHYAPTISSVTGLAHGGARLIGAFIEFEYIGRADDHAGLIEVGLHMHSANSFNDMSRVHFYDQAEIVQAPYYRKFKPADGARCVWFPIDEGDFQFQDYDVSTAGIGETTGAAVVTLRQPVFPEWAINLTGLTTNSSVRIHMCAYYETIVDEAFRDVFMAQRAKATGDPQKMRMAVTEAVAQGAAATPAKSASTWGAMYQTAKEFVNNLNGIYGLTRDVLPIVADLGLGNYGGALAKSANVLFG